MKLLTCSRPSGRKRTWFDDGGHRTRPFSGLANTDIPGRSSPRKSQSPLGQRLVTLRLTERLSDNRGRENANVSVQIDTSWRQRREQGFGKTKKKLPIRVDRRKAGKVGGCG